MIAFSLLVIFLLLIQDILLVILLYSNFQHYGSPVPGLFPNVSVLIPARNEYSNLPVCLESLEKLTYPKEKIQFVFGDDQSEDDTFVLLASWASSKSNVHLISIKLQSPSIPKINGKANALSQMAMEATGEYLLFTDADCQVAEGWIEEMLEGCGPGVGIVTGITTVIGNSFFSKMQRIDWWLTLGMVKILDDLGISITSMGNNMLITREAYWKVGGFSQIPFSLTEDFEIAKKIRAAGFKGIHQVSPQNLVLTAGIKGFMGLLQQRKRWMAGAFGLPLYWKILLALQVLFFPAILGLLFAYPQLGVLTWIVKVFIQGLFLQGFSSVSGEKISWKSLLIFEIYYLFTAWSTIVYYFWPSKTDWKGRLYP